MSINEALLKSFVSSLPAALSARVADRLLSIQSSNPDYRSPCDAGSWKATMEAWEIRRSLAKEAKDALGLAYCDLQIKAAKRIKKGGCTWLRFDSAGVMLLVADDGSEIIAYSLGDR